MLGIIKQREENERKMTTAIKELKRLMNELKSEAGAIVNNVHSSLLTEAISDDDLFENDEKLDHLLIQCFHRMDKVLETIPMVNGAAEQQENLIDDVREMLHLFDYYSISVSSIIINI